MILMWLGSFVLMMSGLAFSQKYAAEFFAGLQRKFFDRGLEVNTRSMFIRAIDVVLLEASPQKSLYSGMAFYNLQVLGLKPSSLIMCLSSLGAWWVIILGFLFMSLSGLFLMGLCSLMLFSFLLTPKVDALLKWIFSSGLFLLGGEIMLRNSSILQATLGENDFIFFMVDGRFTSVAGLLLLGIILSLLIQIEFWSLALGLCLLFTNTLSFNGALGLITGERIGRMLLFWWHTRSLHSECRQLGAQFAAVSSLGALLGLFVAGTFREFIDLGYSTDMNAFQDKSLRFVILFMVILFFQFLAQMAWGHFFVQVPESGPQEAKYISKVWFRPVYFAAAGMAWAKIKVHKRLSEIRYHVAGLETLQEGQVPAHIQMRLKTEEEQLNAIEKLL